MVPQEKPKVVRRHQLVAFRRRLSRRCSVGDGELTVHEFLEGRLTSVPERAPCFTNIVVRPMFWMI